jgi:penicillin-binding protein 1B
MSVAFLIGTAPQASCSHMGEDTQTLGGRLFGTLTGKSSNAPEAPTQSVPNQQPTDASNSEAQKHRNLLQKMFGTGKDKDKPPPQ